MKRSPLRKKSKSNLKRLKDKLWHALSLYVRTRDRYTCITCGRKGEGSAIHAGHFIPDAAGGLALRYDEDNIFAQCFQCNIRLGGWGERYAEVLEERFGREYVDNLRKKKNLSLKWSDQDYIDKTEYYQQKINTLTNNPSFDQ